MNRIVAVIICVFIIGLGTATAWADVFISPDGTYVGGLPNLSPRGAYVGGTPAVTPDGFYSDGLTEREKFKHKKEEKRIAREPSK